MPPTATPTRVLTAAFDQVARVYDTALLQTLVYRPTQEQVISALRGLRPARIVDVGCGTGQLTARLHDEVDAETVYGCDPSSGMLAQAQNRSSRVTWLEGTAEELPLPDASVDAVVSTEAFHFFDQPVALREFCRVLAPGGHIVIGILNPGSPLGSRVLSASGIARWPTRQELRNMATDAGFEVTSQHRVRRVLGRRVPSVVTTARKVG